MGDIEKAIQIVKSECYVNSPLNMDRSIMINEALDILIEAAQKYATGYNEGYEDGYEDGNNATIPTELFE